MYTLHILIYMCIVLSAAVLGTLDRLSRVKPYVSMSTTSFFLLYIYIYIY